MCLTDVVCVESLGGSTCYLMISSRSDGIAAESGLLFPFAMNLSDLSCSCVFHINYTSDAQGESMSCNGQHQVRLDTPEMEISPILGQRMLYKGICCCMSMVFVCLSLL